MRVTAYVIDEKCKVSVAQVPSIQGSQSAMTARRDGVMLNSIEGLPVTTLLMSFSVGISENACT